MSHIMQKRRFQPRFFLFLLVAALLLVGLIVLANVINQRVKARRAEESLDMSGFLLNEDAEDGASPSPEAEQVQVNDIPPLPAGQSYSVVADGSAQPGMLGFSYEIRVGNEEQIYSSNPRKNELSFGKPGTYSKVEGVTTFGGNHYRNSFSYGKAAVTMQKLSQKWAGNTGILGAFSGTDWTGQPLLVRWSPEVRAVLGVGDSYKTKEGFVEVICPSADGKIYFFELETGSQSRSPIIVGVPLLGTGTLDPTGLPLLYVGEGVSAPNEKGNQTAYLHVVNLITNQVDYKFGGYDYFGKRQDWNGFKASPLIIEDTIIFGGENGVLYMSKLNSKFNAEEGTVGIEPGDRIKYRYTGTGYAPKEQDGKLKYGFKASVSAFGNFLFLADNGGRLQCVDLNTLKQLYVVDLGGEADASVVVEEDGNAGTIFLYAMSQTKDSSTELPPDYGYCTVKKIDGFSGKIIWERTQVSYVGEGVGRSGSKATPHVGSGAIGDLLICAYYGSGLKRVDEEGEESYIIGGRLVAYDKRTGEERWSIDQEGPGADYFASPLVIYSTRGNAYLIACDRLGFVKIYDAARGGAPLQDALNLGARIDGTPVAFENYIVVGTKGGPSGGGGKIVGLKIE